MSEELSMRPPSLTPQTHEGSQQVSPNQSDVPQQGMDHLAPQQTTSISAYMERFAEIEEGRIDVVATYPTKEEARALAQLQSEVMIIRSQDQRVYIAKGKHHGDEQVSPGVTMIGRALRALHPISVAHTHPTDRNENPQRSLFGTVIPSAQDLTSRRFTTKTGYIYSEFGRTTFTPIEGAGSSSQSPQQRGDETRIQKVVNNTMSAGFKEAGRKGITDVEEAINYVGQYMTVAGCPFTFERWDQIEDIERPPENFAASS